MHALDTMKPNKISIAETSELIEPGLKQVKFCPQALAESPIFNAGYLSSILKMCIISALPPINLQGCMKVDID